MIKFLTRAGTVAAASMLVAAALIGEARADSALAVRNVQVIDTAHDSFVVGTVVNRSSATLDELALMVDVDGELITVETGADIGPGESWRFVHKLDTRAKTAHVVTQDILDTVAVK